MAARGTTLMMRDGSTGGSMLPWLALALLVLIADQFTKILILGYYKLGDSQTVTSFFNIVRAHNTGMAFSFLKDASGWQRWFLAGVAVVATVFILYLLKKHAGQKLFCFALACILGGAIGNLVDRLLHGYVVDFLQFHWQNRWYFPAFNVADTGITIGAAGLILDELLRVRRSK
jgi:signal peptidase II